MFQDVLSGVLSAGSLVSGLGLASYLVTSVIVTGGATLPLGIAVATFFVIGGRISKGR